MAFIRCRQSARVEAGMAQYCPWCDQPFTPRGNGGRPQRYCSAGCRRALEQALRAWAARQLAEGHVTVAALQHARSAEPRNSHGRTQCPSDADL